MKNIERLRHLAELLVTDSVRLRRGERVFIHNMDTDAGEFINLLHEICIKHGAERVRIWWDTDEIQDNIINHSNKQQAAYLLDGLKELVQDSHVYIKIKSGKIRPLVQSDHIIAYNTKLRPITNLYANSAIRRVLFYYPGKNLAKRLGISQKDTMTLMYRACCGIDWKQQEKDNKRLKRLMEKTDMVRIVGKGTDISFSIKDIPIISAHGRRNMPDGEVFTAPILESVNGKIYFDIPTHFNGLTFASIRLEVRNGKIMKATASNPKKTEALNKILDSHPQNRFFGEFAIGTNHQVKKPVKLTLFDEKIAGTIHMAVGRCYTMANNGNTQATIHWDHIKDMRKPGSCVYFDGMLVMEDGALRI